MMPTTPGSGFKMIQTDFALGFFECGLHRPAHRSERREFCWWKIGRCVAQIIFGFRLCTERTTEDRPAAGSRQSIADRSHAHTGQFHNQRTFTAFLDLAPLPGSSRQLQQQLAQFQRSGRIGLDTRVDARSSHQARSRWFDSRCPQPDPRIDRHLRQIPLAQSGDSSQKCGISGHCSKNADAVMGSLWWNEGS